MKRHLLCRSFNRVGGARGIPRLALLGLAIVAASCGTPDGVRDDSGAPPSMVRDRLFQEGHRLYLTRNFDSAEVVLGRAVGIDSSFVDALTDLGMVHYELAMADPSATAKSRTRHLRDCRKYLARAEEGGTSDAAVYERLCEVSVALADDRGFLKYAKKSADRFPFDRQFYNLGLAYFGVGDFQSVVRTQKEAIEKFTQSPYLGGYYRQLGRAYMKLNRDQTAQRTLEAGLTVVDARLGKPAAERSTAADVKRLGDDRIAILQLLRKLYQTYHFDEKLKSVERRLNDAGTLQ